MSTPLPKRTSTATKAPAKVSSHVPSKTPIRASAKTPARSMPPKPAMKNSSTTSKGSSHPRTPSAKPPPPALTRAKKSPTSTKPVTSTKPTSSSRSDNWVNRSVQTRIQGWGDYAGSLVTGVGDGVNRVGQGVGDSITNVTRGWGQGVAGYGNDIKDAVGVGGPRVPTGGNPLGLAGQGGAKNIQVARKPQRK